MKSELLSNENNEAKFNIFVEEKEFSKAVDDVFKKVKNSIAVPGFRKGKAPRKLVEAAYGKGIFYEDAIDEIISKNYADVIEELQIDPIDQPSVNVGEIKDGEDIKLEFTVEVRPIPELGDFSEVSVTNISTEVSDEEVQARLDSERKKNAIVSEVEDRPAKDGDKVNINFEGFVDGEAFEGGSGEDFDLVLGSKSFIDGFEEQIEGKNIGDEFKVEVTFPEDYEEELKGKDAVFEVKLNSISEEVLPELDDDFAMDVSDYDSLDEYVKSIREELEESRIKEVKNAQENEALENLVEISNVTAPESLINHQLEHEVEDFGNQLQQMGLTLDQYIQYSGQDANGLKEYLRPQAEMKVKADLVINAIILNNDFEVSEEELLAEYEEIKKSMGIAEDSDYIDSIRNDETDEYVKENIERRKAMDTLMKEVKYVDKKEEEIEEVLNDEVED